MRLCVHGLGHIGFPTALLFATEYEVVGVDVDPEVVAGIERGDLPVEEPEIDALFDRVDIETSTEPVAADVHVLAVPTPLEQATNVADLGALRSALDGLGSVLDGDETVIVESTVPPGTAERLVAPSLPAGVGVAYCPERAIPGATVEEMRENDRIVGCSDPETGDRVVALYRAFVEGDIHRTDPTTAEFVKLMENTYRDVNIALANEFGLLAEAADIDVHEARSLANRHPRVDVLRPGPGVGGHCITVDPWFLTGSPATSRLLPVARDVNDTMPDHVLQLVRGAVNGHPGARVAVLGVAYKGGVGDTRETPAKRLCRRLANDGFDIVVSDPYATDFEWSLESVDTATADADCLVVVTDHDVYRDLDPETVGERMATRRLVDTRNLLDHEVWRDAGFEVTVLGDGTSMAN